MRKVNSTEKQQRIWHHGFLLTMLLLVCTCIFCTVHTAQAADEAKTPTELPGLTYDHSMELSYAEEFSVDYYNDGYALITIAEEGQFLVVPEGKEFRYWVRQA